jgi:cell division GTPase FtsZ
MEDENFENKTEDQVFEDKTEDEIFIPDLPIEDFEIPEDKDIGVESTHGGSIEVAFLGGGQGGSRVAEAFYRLGYKKTIVVNTAEHDLKHINLPDNHKIHMLGNEGADWYQVHTRGAGKDMELAAAAASENSQKIYDAMLKVFGKTERILVTVGAGGGTGGGSCRVLVETAKKYLTYIGYDDVEKRVGVIAALPTAGECASPDVARNASGLISGLSDMAENKEISPLLIVDNDKIKKLYPGLTVKKFWPTVNNTIAGLYHTFNKITTMSSEYTTFDPADYDSILRSHGCMILGVTSVKDWSNTTNISNALRSNLTKTLLAGGFDLSTAKSVGVVVVGGSDIFESAVGLMDSIEYGFDTVANIVGKALVHRGIYESGTGKLRVYTIVSGLNRPNDRITELNRFHKKKS